MDGETDALNRHDSSKLVVLDATQPECPPSARLDQIAAGHAAHAAEAVHLASCRACADYLETARFTRRFASVMACGTPPVDEKPNDRVVPGYVVGRELARGGQGVVYAAVQSTTGQPVAIKLLHARGAHAGDSRSARARFLREIRIAGRLAHPGIVRPLDSVLLIDGREALILELVEGDPLDQWASRARQHVDGRRRTLDVLAQIAEALEHAHKRGVIHRDLKPSNVLVDAEGRARILDFGVARRTDPSGLADERITLTGEFTGTLAYAAPEQVSMLGSGPDVRSDVYSLGVMGFEALTGRLPYQVDGALASVIRNITEVDPPRADRAGLDADTSAVLHKAMAKDPARRYQSAADLARDLRSAAAGLAILARADSRWYSIRKAARRHRIPIGVACLLALGVVATLLTLLVGNIRLGAALDESRLLQIRAHLTAGSREQAESLLWTEIADEIREESDPVRMLWRGASREKQLIWCFVEMQSEATCLSMRAASVLPRGGVWPIDGGGFLAATADARLARLNDRGEWISETNMAQLPENASAVRVDPSGTYLICSNASELWTMHATTGERLASVPLQHGVHGIAVEAWGVAISDKTGRLRVLTLPLLEVSLDADNQLPPQLPWLDPERHIIAFIDAGGLIRAIDVATGEEVPPSGARVFGQAQQAGHGTQVLLDPGRTRCVVAFGGGFVVRDLSAAGDATPLFQHHGNRVSVMNDPKWLLMSAVADGDPTLHLWDPRGWRPLGGFPGHQGSVISHAFSRDGARIVTVDASGTLRVWQSPGHSWRRSLTPPTAGVHQLAFNAATGTLVIPGFPTRITSNASTNAPAKQTAPTGGEPAASRVAISPDGMYRAEVGPNRTVTIATTQADEPDTERAVQVDANIVGLQFRKAESGSELGLCLDSNEMLILDPRTAQVLERTRFPIGALASDMAWSADGERAAVTFRDGTLAIMERSGDIRTLRVAEKQLRSLAFLPGGSRVAVVGDTGRLHIVDIATGRCRASARLSEHSLFCVAMHPAGDIAMIGDRAGKVMAIDLEDLTERASFDAEGSVMSIVFSPDGDDLAVAAVGMPVQLWSVTELARTFAAIRPE